MNEQLRHIIRHLYGEASSVPLDDLLRDDAVRAEYEALQDVKRRLDERPSARPPAEVVDRVVAAATPAQDGASPKESVRVRADRLPLSRAGGSRRRVLQALAVTFTIVIGLAVVFMQVDVTPSSPYATETQQAPRAAESAEPESFAAEAERAAPEAPAPVAEQMAEPEAPAPAEAGAPALASRREVAQGDVAEGAEATEPAFEARVGLAASQAPPDTLAWDESDTVQRLRRRIELLEARSAETAWDDPAVMSLDALPGQPAPSRFDRGLNTVREQRPSSGDQ